MANVLELELALQDGMSVEVKGDRVIITIDTEKTKRDLWTSQIQMWLSERLSGKDDFSGCVKMLSSGYLRVVRNKLNFIKG